MSKFIRGTAFGLGLAVSGLSCANQAKDIPELSSSKNSSECIVSNLTGNVFNYRPQNESFNNFISRVTGFNNSTEQQSLIADAVCSKTITPDEVIAGKAVTVEGKIGGDDIFQTCAVTGIFMVRLDQKEAEPNKIVRVICPLVNGKFI